jgi:hypothetical protein
MAPTLDKETISVPRSWLFAQVLSDLQFKCQFSEEIQINELNPVVIENTFIIVPKWYI